jgi:CheY-like chemotaxis protein
MGRPLLVIVVEDHPLHARLLAVALHARLPVERYGDGLEASRRLIDPTRAVPDLLVLDLALPGRDGHELLRERATHAWLAAVPTAIVTSSESAADRERSLALGAGLHLAKPSDGGGFALLADRLATLVG